MLQVDCRKRTAISALLLIVGSGPWLLTLSWRPLLVGVLAVTAAICLFVLPRAGRVLLVATVGISSIMFVIAGLHREGIDIGDRPYIGMQLLTPFSIVALLLTFRRSRLATASGTNH
jgi:hypothetical protein